MIKNKKFLLLLYILGIGVISVYGQQFKNNTNSITRPFEFSADSIIKLKESIPLEEFKSSMSRPEMMQISISKSKKINQTAKQIYNSAVKSTVIVGTAYLCPHCSKTHLSTASGYIISEDGVMVTNSHVIEGYVNMFGGNKPLGIFIRLYDGRTFQAVKVLGISEKDDLAILKIDTKGKKIPALSLSNGAEIGDDAYVLGHPKSMYYFFTKGIVNSKFQDISRTKQGQTYFDVMNISADYAAGSSGGPVLDTRGNIIGTVSSTKTIKYNDPDKSVQMVLKSTIPVESLWRLLHDIKEGKKNGGLPISFLENQEQKIINVSNNLSVEDLKVKYAKEMIKKPAIDFSLKNLNGKIVSLSDFKGKVVVLDFWATWCKPCIGSFPGMQSVLNKYKADRNVEFLFIDCFEQQEDYKDIVQALLKDKGYTFNVLFDQMMDNNKSITTAYGVKGIPTKVVIDKNGFIRFQSSGSGANIEQIVNEMSSKIELAKEN